MRLTQESYLGLIGESILFLALLKVVLGSCRFVYAKWLISLVNQPFDLKSLGSWAVVTGSSDGIGKAYAFKLATMGLNIVLISRTPSKLERVANEIRKKCPGVEVKTIAVDFTSGPHIFPLLERQLQNVPTGVLVNNVGMTCGSGPFTERVPNGQVLSDLINCNVTSTVQMTRIVLSGMLKRRCGLVVNVGSISGVGSTPLDTIYGATKAFVDKFSRDLAAECKADGVIVQSVLPGFVATKMPGLEGRSSWVVPTPEAFVEAHIRTIGVETRTAAYWFHDIMLYWIELLHFFMPNTAEWLTFKFFKARVASKKKMAQFS